MPAIDSPFPSRRKGIRFNSTDAVCGVRYMAKQAALRLVCSRLGVKGGSFFLTEEEKEGTDLLVTWNPSSFL